MQRLRVLLCWLISFALGLSNYKTTLNTSGYVFGFQYGSSGLDYTADIWADRVTQSIYLTGNTNQSLYGPNIGVQDVFLSKHECTNGEILWKTQYGTDLPESGVSITSSEPEHRIYVSGYTTGYLYQNYSSKISYYSYEVNKPGEDLPSPMEVTLCQDQTFHANVCSYYFGASTNYPSFSLYDWRGRLVTTSSSSLCEASLLYTYTNSGCESYSLVFQCSFSTCSARAALIIYSYPPLVPVKTVDTFISCHDSMTGTLVWGIQFGTSDIDAPAKIVQSTPDNCLYIVGYTQGSLYSSRSGGNDLYLSKINSTSGELVWGYQNGTALDDAGVSLVVNNLDNTLYVLGSTGYDWFSSRNGVQDVVLLEISSDGKFLWGIQFGSGSTDYPTDIGLNSDGYLYICGYSVRYNYDSSFLFKINPQSRGILWNKIRSHQYSWGLALFNSSIYTIATTKKKYLLYESNPLSGEVLWEAKVASVPSSFLPWEIVRGSVAVTMSGVLTIGGSTEIDLYNHSYGLVDYYLLSPQICDAGYYSEKYTSPCLECPKNTYSHPVASKCTPCPHGEYSDPGSTHCKTCFGGYYHNHHSDCFHTSQHFVLYFGVLVLPVLILTICLLMNSWVGYGFSITALLSTADFLSDLLYLTTTFFYNSTLFYLSIFFLFPPLIDLYYDLWWKSSHTHHQLRIFHLLPSTSSNSLINLILGFLLFVPYMLLTLLLGYYLIQTKLLSLPHYEEYWHSLHFLTPHARGNEGRVSEVALSHINEESAISSDVPSKSGNTPLVNLHRLNTAIIVEICFEAIPQIIVQTINNTLMNAFGTIAIISLVISVLIIINTLYRLLYYYMYHGVPLSEIPIAMKEPTELIPKKLLHQDSGKDTLRTILLPSETTEGNSAAAGSSDTSGLPLLIHFDHGPHGLTFKTTERNGQRTMEVLLIDSHTELSYPSLKRGYRVDTINGLHLIESTVSLASGYCSHPCDVTFLPPVSRFIKLSLSSLDARIRACSTSFSDVHFCVVEFLHPSSLASQSGLAIGDYLISINDEYYYHHMSELLTPYPPTPPSDTPLECLFLVNPGQSSFALDLELLLNHFRSSGIFPIRVEDSIPYLGSYPLFFRAINLENIVIVFLYFLLWLTITLFLLFLWIPLWIVFILLKWIFYSSWNGVMKVSQIVMKSTTPLNSLLSHLSYFTMTLEFYFLCYILQGYLSIIVLVCITYLGYLHALLWWGTLTVLTLPFLGSITRSVNASKLTFLVSMALLLLQLFLRPSYPSEPPSIVTFFRDYSPMYCYLMLPVATLAFITQFFRRDSEVSVVDQVNRVCPN